MSNSIRGNIRNSVINANMGDVQHNTVVHSRPIINRNVTVVKQQAATKSSFPKAKPTTNQVPKTSFKASATKKNHSTTVKPTNKSAYSFKSNSTKSNFRRNSATVTTPKSHPAFESAKTSSYKTKIAGSSKASSRYNRGKPAGNYCFKPSYKRGQFGGKKTSKYSASFRKFR